MNYKYHKLNNSKKNLNNSCLNYLYNKKNLKVYLDANYNKIQCHFANVYL